MKITLDKVGQEVHFVITELEPVYHPAALTIGYQTDERGLVRKFPANALHIERAYENAVRQLDRVLLQRSETEITHWEDAMTTLLGIVAGSGLDWCVVGSAALALRGIDVTPGDIDLVTGEDDALKLGDLALDYLIEPIQETTDWVGRWWARSFMGMCVEWVGGVNASADAFGISDFGPVALSRLETIQWRGYDIRVPPLDLQLAVNERRGREDTAAEIRKALGDS